jgi:hypothetical protein
MVVDVMKNHVIAPVNSTPVSTNCPMKPYGVEKLIIHIREHVNCFLLYVDATSKLSMLFSMAIG